MTVGDKPLDLEKDYSIASVHTRFQGNPLFGATHVKDTDKIFSEELIKYVRQHSPIKARLDDRIMDAR